MEILWDGLNTVKPVDLKIYKLRTTNCSDIYCKLNISDRQLRSITKS
jgi:hypothetical protein